MIVCKTIVSYTYQLWIIFPVLLEISKTGFGETGAEERLKQNPHNLYLSVIFPPHITRSNNG